MMVFENFEAIKGRVFENLIILISTGKANIENKYSDKIYILSMNGKWKMILLY